MDQVVDVPAVWSGANASLTCVPGCDCVGNPYWLPDYCPTAGKGEVCEAVWPISEEGRRWQPIFEVAEWQCRCGRLDHWESYLTSAGSAVTVIKLP